MIVNVTNSGNSNRILSFDEKVNLVKRCICAPDGWSLLVKSMKNSGIGSARVQCLAILRKIANDEFCNDKKLADNKFQKLVGLLNQHLD